VRLQYVSVVWPPLCSAHLLPVAWQGPNAVSRRALWGLLTALVPALLMNICIVGINQIFDVAIDKVRCPLLCMLWPCNNCTANQPASGKLHTKALAWELLLDCEIMYRVQAAPSSGRTAFLPHGCAA